MPWKPHRPAQIDTIRRWIASGAAWPEGVTIQVAEARPAVLPVRSASRPRNPRHLSYNRDVRPILAESCFPCHGPDKAARKAGLRLDREEIAKGTLASGTVPVVAGEPDKSALVARLLHADEERRMPLAKAFARLSSEQIATLRRWIAEGAGGSRTGPIPRATDASATRDSRWGRNAVDAFILAGVEAALRPSPGLARGSSAASASTSRACRCRRRSAPSRRTRGGRYSGRSTACSRRPASASAWRSSARPRTLPDSVGATTATTRARCGAIATGSSGLERQPAVRSLHRRAARRPAPGRRRRRQDRFRLQQLLQRPRRRRSVRSTARLPRRPRQERLE